MENEMWAMSEQIKEGKKELKGLQKREMIQLLLNQDRNQPSTSHESRTPYWSLSLLLEALVPFPNSNKVYMGGFLRFNDTDPVSWIYEAKSSFTTIIFLIMKKSLPHSTWKEKGGTLVPLDDKKMIES